MNTEKSCEHCATWGRTIELLEAQTVYTIPCPKCKRKTWPNLGVNCPAGMAVAIGAANAMMLLQAQEIRKQKNGWADQIGKQWFNSRKRKFRNKNWWSHEIN